MSAPTVEPGRDALLLALERGGVEFVVIGGVAARTQGWGEPTEDLDITPEPSAENLDRLARCLRYLRARYAPEGLERGMHHPVGIEAEQFGQMTSARFVTRHGQLDLSFRPDGIPGGYEELRRRARRMQVADTRAHAYVAHMDDVLRSKEAAGRAKDLAQLDRMRRDFESWRRERGRKG